MISSISRITPIGVDWYDVRARSESALKADAARAEADRKKLEAKNSPKGNLVGFP